jgi:hypothetical protein
MCVMLEMHPHGVVQFFEEGIEMGEGASSEVEKEFQLVDYTNGGGVGVTEYGGHCSSIDANGCGGGKEVE